MDSKISKLIVTKPNYLFGNLQPSIRAKGKFTPH